ncbi:MAG: hypothetical protein ACD_39C01013G0002 [uncultured bacterium]|nr:MAG: hypothetical protein ACD_39C01013G0002 [uncultured bacterium]
MFSSRAAPSRMLLIKSFRFSTMLRKAIPRVSLSEARLKLTVKSPPAIFSARRAFCSSSSDILLSASAIRPISSLLLTGRRFDRFPAQTSSASLTTMPTGCKMPLRSLIEANIVINKAPAVNRIELNRSLTPLSAASSASFAITASSRLMSVPIWFIIAVNLAKNGAASLI